MNIGASDYTESGDIIAQRIERLSLKRGDVGRKSDRKSGLRRIFFIFFLFTPACI